VDGHDFIVQAAELGAGACLIRADRADSVPDDVAAVAVDDPADALLGLGAWVRQSVDPTVVAVTGSSGKTTTKDFIAAAVGAGRATVATPGSYNNDLGVPLTCCRLEPATEVLVAEVGARGVGHIAALAIVLAPDIAVVTTVTGAHLEQFGDLETVARAKGELVEALGADGLAVLNADDARALAMTERTKARTVTYGLGSAADWRAEDLALDPLARATFVVRGVPVRLPVPGEHNVRNALAALAVADACGVPMADAAAALAEAPVSKWRMELIRTRGGVTVINDAYNANPDSMAAALKTLASVTTSGRRWAVLGHMAELGADSDDQHDRVGRLTIRLGIDGLVIVGQEAAGIRAAADLEGFYGEGDLFGVPGPDQAVEVLEERLRPGDVVLVKASRSAGLERVATALTAAFGGPE
jgi:UDP-N-acetylmuramoyl-tripeptide--D-alanyl-D-alanine ligase